MGNVETKPSDCSEQPWWSIENEIFLINQPNLSEIYASISAPDEIKYPTVREKILAKLRDRKYSASSDSEDQSAGENHEKYVVIKKINNNKNNGNGNEEKSTASRSCSESEPVASTSMDTTSSSSSLDTTKTQSLDEFKEELRIKRVARQEAINDLRSELNTLRQQLAEERELNCKLRNGDQVIDNSIQIEKKDISIGTEDTEDSSYSINDNSSNNTEQIKASCDICIQTDEIQFSNILRDNFNCNCNCGHDIAEDNARNETRITRSSSDTQQINLKAQLAELQLSLQLANADNLSLTTELAVVKKQVASLKEVIACSRQMIEVRDEQVQQLKAKLRQIEESLADRELRIMSENLRQEYDRQLANIRNLRQLYEERARVSAAERENLLRQIQIKKDELAVEILKVRTLEERISNLESELTASKDKLCQTKEERDDLYIENKSLKDEMAVINKLFSQMLTGFNGTDNLDIDRLTAMLEENRTLLSEMATKESNSEGASLPKLLFDIVNQANKNEYEYCANELVAHQCNNENEKQEQQSQEEIITEQIKVTSAQEIIGNLPKVWRILIEFLNHQKVEQVQFKENGQSEECYKSVQTSTGTKSEISVSKTYLKLKDLILEKKSLMKETNRLKTLNSHLERRLDEQEKRLSVVSLELTKTWHLVGKMQRQHRQLHTHEQILRYQLQQKKRLLNELKEELEYCRRKWAAARAKNAESQLQCDDLRKEFAKRKLQDANNSGESGYSDGPASSDEETSPTLKNNFKDFLEAPRKLERTHSISPVPCEFQNLMVRCSSAPPVTTFLSELLHTADEISTNEHEPPQNIASTSTEPDQAVAKATLPPTTSLVAENNSSTGAIPKQGIKNIKLSRGKKLEKYRNNESETESLEEMFQRISGLPADKESSPINPTEDELKRADRVKRIQQLEEQCKSLIAQVIETSGSREKLEIQICKFKDEIGPAQHPIPFDEYLARRRSSASVLEKGPTKTDESCLTAREAEYTSRRSERLKRLEDESNQLMTRIRRTTDRGKSMTTLLDRIHLRCVGSREGSFDSTHSTDDTDHEGENSTSSHKNKTEQMNIEKEIKPSQNALPVGLTPQEEEYTTRRSERLKRLEEESKLLMTKLSKQYNKGKRMNSRIDALHLRYGSEDGEAGTIVNDQKESKVQENDLKLPQSFEEKKEMENVVTDGECEGATAIVDDGEETVEKTDLELCQLETSAEVSDASSAILKTEQENQDSSRENVNQSDSVEESPVKQTELEEKDEN